MSGPDPTRLVDRAAPNRPAPNITDRIAVTVVHSAQAQLPSGVSLAATDRDPCRPQAASIRIPGHGHP
jgi:hypothetical protein